VPSAACTWMNLAFLLEYQVVTLPAPGERRVHGTTRAYVRNTGKEKKYPVGLAGITSPRNERPPPRWGTGEYPGGRRKRADPRVVGGHTRSAGGAYTRGPPGRARLSDLYQEGPEGPGECPVEPRER